MTGLEAARQLLQRCSRIAFPPELGEPGRVAELPELLSATQADVFVPWRTQRQALRSGPSVARHVVVLGGRGDGAGHTPHADRNLPRLVQRGGALAIDVALVRVGPSADPSIFRLRS